MSMRVEATGHAEEYPLDLNPSICTRIGRICSVVYEVVIKEICSVFTATANWFRYVLNPNKYNLNPKKIVADNQSAKVTILLHGQGGGPFCFFPMAKELEKQGVNNVFTVKLSPTDQDPVPLKELKEKIEKIEKQCLDQGIKGLLKNKLYNFHPSGSIV